MAKHAILVVLEGGVEVTSYNFSAGPATLPKAVLEKAQSELLNYQSTGMSVLELSHRSETFGVLITETERLLRTIMGIPDQYRVLFLQGGASTQFSMVPLNLAQGKKAYYHVAGIWGKKAYAEAVKLSQTLPFEPLLLASSEESHFDQLPQFDAKKIDASAAYVHLTTNNTVEGTSLYDLPDTNGVPIVVDMSSNILAVPYQVEQFGMIYAGAQKNLGPAGVTVVIIREDLINTLPTLSSMLDYRIQAEAGSRYNTPPVYSIYITKLVLEWLRDLGGIEVMAERNRKKALLLYDAIDQSSFYQSPLKYSKERSVTNIVFKTPNRALDATFIEAADACGLKHLKGHSSFGGIRASLYNAFPIEGVHALIDFMAAFEKKHQIYH